MKTKKVIFTVTNDLVYDQRMIRICSSLAKQGYQVLLIGRLHSRSKPLDQLPFDQRRFSCFFEKGKLFYLEYNFRLFWFLLFAKFDALCSIDLDTLLPGFLVTKLRNKALIYDAHEYFTEVPEVIERPMVKRIWEGIATFVIPKLKHAYTVCESLSEIFEDQYQIAFSVIRNVPFAQKKQAVYNRKNKTKILLYQGALNAGRGLEQALEAMIEVADAELWLAGEGDLSELLRKQVKAFNLNKKVIFKGYLKPEELKKITTQADVGLNLLENKSLNYYYSLANKAFDYIQAGIPAIHMDFPEYRKLNEEFETALLIKDLKPVSIANAINKLLNEQDLYLRLSANCNKAAAHYTWENEEQKLIEFYQRVFQVTS